jgi:histidine triad (HIT) family protein
MSDCIFCKISKGEIKAEKIYDDGEVFCIPDINPMAPTHILMIPHKHIPTLMDVTEPDFALIGKIFKVAQEMAKKAGVDEDGFRVLHNVKEWGSQRVMHIHFHLLGGKRYDDH